MNPTDKVPGINATELFQEFANRTVDDLGQPMHPLNIDGNVQYIVESATPVSNTMQIAIIGGDDVYPVFPANPNEDVLFENTSGEEVTALGSTQGARLQIVVPSGETLGATVPSLDRTHGWPSVNVSKVFFVKTIDSNGRWVVFHKRFCLSHSGDHGAPGGTRDGAVAVSISRTNTISSNGLNA